MKRSVKPILTLAVCLVLLAAVAGCTPNEDNGGTTTVSTTTTTGNDGVTDSTGDTTDPSGDVTDPSGDSTTQPTGTSAPQQSGSTGPTSSTKTTTTSKTTPPTPGPNVQPPSGTTTSKTTPPTPGPDAVPPSGATIQVGNLTVHQKGEPYVTGGKALNVMAMLPYTTDGFLMNFDINKQAFAKLYEEKSGIKIDYQYYARPDIFVLKSTMLNSGNIPDLFVSVPVGFRSNEVFKYGNQGFFADLTDKLEDWAPNLYGKLHGGEYNFAKIVTYAFGKVYALPGLKNLETAKGTLMGNQPMINTAWLDELGLEIPTTTDEFYEVCKAFTEEDPDGNGKNDTFGFGGPLFHPVHWSPWGLGMSWYAHGSITEKGEVLMGPLTDQFREGCRFYNRMWEEGLMCKSMFGCSAAAFKSLVPKTGIVCEVSDTSMQKVLSDSELKNWQAIAWPTGKNLGDFKAGTSAAAGADCYENVFFIGKSAKCPEAILRWLDYFYTDDGAMLWHYGPAGKAYTEVGGKYKLLKNAESLAADQKMICSYAPLQPHNVMARNKSDMTVREQFNLRMQEEAKKIVKRTTYNFEWLDMLKTEAEAAAIDKLKYPGDWNWGVQAIRGDVDIETDWNSYKNQHSKDYAAWKNIYQGIFNRHFR